MGKPTADTLIQPVADALIGLLFAVDGAVARRRRARKTC